MFFCWKKNKPLSFKFQLFEVESSHLCLEEIVEMNLYDV